MIKLLFLLFYFIALVVNSEQVIGEGTEQDLFSLSLEQLLKIQVTSTSRTSNRADTSEGIISVITADEITLFGAKNLVDVLQRLPATIINAEALALRDVVSVRGDWPIVGEHVLFLINNRPFRITALGSAATRVLLYGFPINQIKQIEFVQGSASVLYGANAYSAVVNIITKDADDTRNYLATTLGSDNALQLQFSGQIVQDSFTANLAGSYFKSDGWDSTFLDSDSSVINHNLQHDNAALWAELEFGDLKFSGYSNKVEGNYYGLKAPFETNDPFKDEVQYLDVGYQLYDSVQWKSKLSLSSIWSESLNLKSHEVNVDFENHFKFESSNLLLGANLTKVVEADNTIDLPILSLDKFSSELHSIFSHYNYRYHSTNFIIGVMWLKFSGFDSQWVPRLGVVHQFNEQWIAKVLYNEGYRPPNAIETGLNIFDGLAVGNKLLIPEHIKTIESQLSYSKNEYHIALSVFKTTQDELINFVSSTEDIFPLSFFNTEQREFIGGALEARYRYNRFDIQSSYSYQENKRTQFLNSTEQVDNITQIPQHTFKLGISYSKANYSISLFDTYTSTYPINELDLSAKVNEKAGNDHNVSLNVIWNFERKYQGLSLSLFINNLLDNDLYVKQFETTADSINSYPHDTSRAAYVTLSYQF